MQELTAIINASREREYERRKFQAAIAGVDIEKGQGEDAWKNLKAKVASRGKAADGNDILGLQGQAAKSAGFGIGLGLEAETINQSANPEYYEGGDK